ncbi:hypothetical protein ACE4ZN_00585 [Enterococcus faecalis]|uniref:hypothetical protein n=1 Tax=Enterococcus faecalis TaxID=1351 RepID=UPI0022429E9B
MRGKNFFSLFAAIMVIFCFSVPLSVSATELSDTKIQHLESNIDVKIIEENLSLKKNENGISLVTINDEDKLSNELKNINSLITVIDVKATVNAFNNQLILENGNGELTDLLIKNLQNQSKYSFRSKNSGMCSAVMGGAGLAHTTLYGAAAWALGVTGPAGWLVGAGIGAAYYAGSLLC